MEAVDVEYSASSTQVFHIGAASVAVPGAVAGLAAAHRAYASRPWAELIAPAAELARDGVRADAAAGVPARDPRRDPAPHRRGACDVRQRREQAPRRRRAAPARARGHARAARRARRRRSLPAASSARRVVEHVREHGGRLTTEDLASYRVLRRRPIRVPFLGREFVSNPPPSRGGLLIGYGLHLLGRLGAGGPPGSADAIAMLVEVMRETTRARSGELRARALPRRRRAAAATPRRRSRRRRRGSGSGCPASPSAAPRGTTHISSVDAAGNAASLTDLDRLRLGRDRPGHRDPAEQHARRVRPRAPRSARRRAGG